MSAGRDVERLIADWLVEESPGRAPDRILAEAGQTIDRTKQRRFAAAWREPVSISMRGLVAMAAVLVLAVIGAGLVGRSTASIGAVPSSTPGAGLPSPSAALSSAPIPNGTYTTAPIPVADIIAMIDGDTNLTPADRTALIETSFEINGHTTFIVAIVLQDGQWTQHQVVDGVDQVGSRATYAFLDATTLIVRDQLGLGGFQITPVENGFRLKALSPEPTEAEALTDRILFESAPFIRTP